MIKYIKKHTLLFFILILLACFEPPGLENFFFYHELVILLKAFFILISLLILLKHKKVIEYKFLIGYSIFCIYVVGVHFFTRKSYGYYYAYLYYGFMIIIFYSYFLKINYLNGVRAIIIVMSIFLSLNYLSIVTGRTFESELFSSVFFLGIKTSMTQFAVLLITALFYYIKRHKKAKPDFYVIIGSTALVLTLLSAFKLAAGAALICITILIALFFVPKLSYFYTYRIALFIIAFALVLAIPVLNLHTFVKDILGSFFDVLSIEKNVSSLTGRDQIWALALFRISQNPIIGAGEMGVESIYDKNLTLVLCHNQFIQLLLEAGIIGLLLFMFAFLKRIIKTKNSPSFKYWYSGFLVYHVLFITEVISWNFILITFLLLINSQYDFFSRTSFLPKELIHEKNTNSNT